MLNFDELKKLFEQGRINRREFLIRASALGITATLYPTLFTSQAHASTPKKGGRFRLGLYGGMTTDSLEPGMGIDVFPRNISWQIRNCLTEIDHKAEPIPELAESWEFSGDAKEWIFKLRKGVEFHNGKTMDATDVVFSINHHRGEKSKSAATTLVKEIKDIKTDGKYTVVFTLTDGNVDFPAILSDNNLAIVPAGTSGTEFQKGIGTGGYILKSWSPGVKAFVKRNPNYWKEGRAHFDEVETFNMTDTTARTNALKAGQIDAMHSCDLKTVHLLEKTPGIQIVRVAGRKHYTFPMRTDISPYDNNDVRLALKYGVDRKSMLKLILRGYGSLGNDHPLSPSYRYFASDLPQREYDPDKARFHLKKAGMESYKFELRSAQGLFPGSIDAAILYKEHLAKANVNVEVITEPKEGYWKEVWTKKPWCMCYWNGRATEDFMFSQAFAADSKWNDSHWKNERFNNLLKEARAELDKNKRREMYVEMQSLIRDKGGVVIPVFTDFIDAATKKIKFGKLSGSFGCDGERCAERWWFDS